MKVTYLIAINFRENRIFPIDQIDKSKNVFTTPLLADIDSDGYLDIIHADYPHSEDLGILEKPIKWGSYMGTNGDGIYK